MVGFVVGDFDLDDGLFPVASAHRAIELAVGGAPVFIGEASAGGEGLDVCFGGAGGKLGVDPFLDLLWAGLEWSAAARDAEDAERQRDGLELDHRDSISPMARRGLTRALREDQGDKETGISRPCGG